MGRTFLTPLDTALKASLNKEIADLLRKHGGKTGEELKGGEPVAEASQPKPPTKAPDISLLKAAIDGNIEAVKQHLAAGADVDARDRQDKTPLQHAAYWGHKEIAELLIAKGADVNAKDKHGRTPLHFAAWKGHKEIVEQLIAKGGDVNTKAEGGWTPLHYRGGGDDKDIVELLIAAGADVNAKIEDGRTPLDRAEETNNKETADLLRKHGAKSGAEDSIHIAAMVGNIVAVKKHLSDGANFNAKDNDGKTPLDWAEDVKNWQSSETKVTKKEIANLLRKHGGKTGEELKAEGN
jgi:cytohesin